MPEDSGQNETAQKPARAAPTCWVVTEGMAGTENQCIGIAEALGVEPVVKRVKLRSPWKQLSPYLRIGNMAAIDPAGDTLEPPWPDLLIASGRKSVAPALAVKKASQGKTLIVQVQDPRVSPKLFDLLVVPQHDPARGDNVLVTTGALHKVTPARIASDTIKFADTLAALPQPRVAVLIGGTSKAHTLTPDIARSLADMLKKLVDEQNASLMITASRRTGEDNEKMLREALRGDNIRFWDGQGDNPYFAYLGYADYIIVTEDSVTMVSEAISTGKPVYVMPLDGGSARFDRFHSALREQGYTRPFAGALEKWTYTPPEDTRKVADEIMRRLKL